MLITLLRNAVARKEPGVNVLLYGPPGTGKTELAKVVRAGRRAASCSRSSTPTATAIRCRAATATARCRSPGVPEGQRAGGAAVRRGRGRVPADQHRGRAADGARRAGAGAGQRQRQRQGLGQPDPRDRTPVPTIWVTNRIEQIDPAFRRRFAYHLELKSPPPGAREQLVRKTLDGVAVSRGLRRQAGRAQGPDAGADPHRGALRRSWRMTERQPRSKA